MCGEHGFLRVSVLEKLFNGFGYVSYFFEGLMFKVFGISNSYI